MKKYLTGRVLGFALIALPMIALPAWARFDQCPQFVSLGDPGGLGTDLCRTGYAALHNSYHKVPLWVAERLTREQVQAQMDRTDDFRPDTDLPKGERSELSDYRGSGYDRGHMAPAADMRWSAEAMSESFLLSNMVPQIGVGMNRGIWADLESHVRKWTETRGELLVITGPVFSGNVMTIGKNDVTVPSGFFKVVYDSVMVDAIAFLMPNRALKRDELPEYVVTVDAVEQDTGLDFFHLLRDDVEVIVESTLSPMWVH